MNAPDSIRGSHCSLDGFSRPRVFALGLRQCDSLFRHWYSLLKPRKVLWVIAILLALSMSIGAPIPISGAATEDSVQKVRWVDLNALYSLHPMWTQYQNVIQVMEAEEEEWRDYIDRSQLLSDQNKKFYEGILSFLDSFLPESDRSAKEQSAETTGQSGETQQTADDPIIQDLLSQFEADLQDLIAGKLEEKSRAIEAGIQDELYTIRGEMNNELDAYVKAIQQEYLPLTLNLQLKLELADLKPEDRKKVESELLRLETEINDKISAKKKALEEEFTRKANERQAAADIELMRYKVKLVDETRSAVEQERARLLSRYGVIEDSRKRSISKGLQSEVGSLSHEFMGELQARIEKKRAEFQARQEEFEMRQRALLEKRDALLEKIHKDIQSLVRIYGKANGFEIVTIASPRDKEVLMADASKQYQDISSEVSEFIRHYFNSEGSMRQGN
ncbi:MAG TPA: hypothetical protein GX509_01670 [Firmicutes bacterium]|nr:hypothetical protein [Bacillota bacterium]